MLRSSITTTAFWLPMGYGVCAKELDSRVLPPYLVSRVVIFAKLRQAI